MRTVRATTLKNQPIELAGCAIFLLVAAIFAVPLSAVFGYCVETIAGFMGKTGVDVPLLHPVALLAGLALSEVAVPLAIILWLVGFFV